MAHREGQTIEIILHVIKPFTANCKTVYSHARVGSMMWKLLTEW